MKKKLSAVALGAVALLFLSTPGVEAQPTSTDRAGSAGAPGRAAQYCTNIADAAADARFAWQKQELEGLEKQIDARIAVLEAKRAEYEEWLRRRNEFLAKADEAVVSIYSRMRAEAAAQQLATMGDEAAAAILAKLPPRIASAVLNEMEAGRAAQLANTMTDTPKRPREGGRS